MKNTKEVGVNVFILIKVISYIVSGYFIVSSFGFGILHIMGEFGLIGGVIVLISLLFVFFHITLTKKI